MNDLENFYFKLPEPQKSCLLALKEIILKQDVNVRELWKWGGPFFYYKSKVFCYLWLDKKNNEPYLGIVEGKHVEHKLLAYGNRTRIKVMRFDANKDLPIKAILNILKQALDVYRNGIIKAK